MNNKTTAILAACVGFITLVIGVGFFLTPSENNTPSAVHKTIALPTASELEKQLASDQILIDTAILAKYPEFYALYTVERGALYHDGSWYGAVLQYEGPDSENRDTLRLVMHRINGEWEIITTPPQILVSKQTIPNAPKAMLDDLNKPATLRGTETSPTITPGE